MKNLTEIHVVGGKSLAGNISIQGSKNAALPMMAAALMHRGLSILKKCPKISDVFCMEEILKNLGAVTWWEDHDLYLIVPMRTKQRYQGNLPEECVLPLFSCQQYWHETTAAEWDTREAASSEKDL